MQQHGLRQGLQVIVQGPATCDVQCDGVYEVPSTNPAYIAIVPDGSYQADTEARALRFELLKRLVALPGARSEATAMPCDRVPACRSGYGCHAFGVPACRTVVVLIGDPAAAWRYFGAPLTIAPSEIIPLMPPGFTIGAPLPSPLDVRNARNWSVTPIEFVPQIFAAAGISSSDARIFISYRVKEASALCEQLFDALNRAGFDVFVDRFRIAVGADFQQRILEELASKGMVVFLETNGILASKWTRYEAAVAKSARLGLLSVQPPGGRSIPDVDTSRRLIVDPIDWDGSTGTLSGGKLTEVIDRIRRDHAFFDIRRRQLLRDSMRRALQQAGVTSQQLLPSGAIDVVTPRGDPFVFWLPSRPADLSDFHHLATAGGTRAATRAIFGPASHMVGRAREAARWLSSVSSIPSFDESQIRSKAQTIARGGSL